MHNVRAALAPAGAVSACRYCAPHTLTYFNADPNQVTADDRRAQLEALLQLLDSKTRKIFQPSPLNSEGTSPPVMYHETPTHVAHKECHVFISLGSHDS